MKAGVFIFILAFAVSSSENQQRECINRYLVDCAVPLINQWDDITKCSVAVPFTTCIANVSADCDKNYEPLLKKVANLLQNACYPDKDEIKALNDAAECVAANSSRLEQCTANLPEDTCNASTSFLECAKSQLQDCGKIVASIMDRLLHVVELLYGTCSTSAETDYHKLQQCFMDNATTILSCKVPGEFNTVGDICSYIGNFRQCIVSKSEQVCGEQVGELVRLSTQDVAFIVELCKNITAINEYPVPECEKAILECRSDVPLVEQKCTDIPKYLECIAGATKKCKERVNPLFAVLLINYKNKFPVYCDKDSAFNKNIQTKKECIATRSHTVASDCFLKLQNAMAERKEEDVVGKQRAVVNFLNCLSSGFSKECAKEAGDAVNDLLQPLGDTLDESCRLLTGKRCNNACGLQVATWMLIAAVVYLLTRKYE